MANKIRPHTNERQQVRFHKKMRIRKKIVRQHGLIPRLVVYRSNKFLYAQIIDDLKGHTVAQANTREIEFSTKTSKKNLEAAKTLGKLIGKRAIDTKVERVLFDRNGYDYHGRVQAIADGAREAGLKF